MWKPAIVKEHKTNGKKLTKKQTILVIMKVLKSHGDMWRLCKKKFLPTEEKVSLYSCLHKTDIEICL